MKKKVVVGSEKQVAIKAEEENRMADVTIYMHDLKTGAFYPVLYHDNGDGTYSPTVVADLVVGDTLVLAAGEAHVGEVGGHIDTVAVEFTRENNATPYTAGDVVSSSAGTPVVLEIPLALRIVGGSAYIVGCRVTFNVKSVTPRLRVHLFNASNPTIAGDNLAHKELYADAAKRLGYFDMDAMSTAADATNSDMARSINMDLRIPVMAAAATRSLWVAIETLDAVTLTAVSKVSITLSLDVN